MVQPNVIWVIADQLRAQAMGYAGDPNVCTPNLDRLAAEGSNFTRAVSGTPLCCPYRGALLTGRYPHRSGVAGHEYPLPADATTVASVLRVEGYRTCYVGKWHLDGNRPELAGSGPEGQERVRMIPPDRRGGFEDWWAYENNNRPFDCLAHTDRGRTPDGAAVLTRSNGMESFRVPGYEVDGLTDILTGWMSEQADQRPAQPFFGVLSVQPPHNPYTAPAEVMGRHTPGRVELRANVPPIGSVQERARRDLAGYYAAIERIDHNIGRIRHALQDSGFADNTYLVFLSDHGDMHGSHGQWRKTAPWEEAIRVPFLVAGPSREHQSADRIDLPINHVDIAATTLGLCGMATPHGMDGTDYSGLIRREVAADDFVGDDAYLGIPVPTGHGESVDRAWRGVVTRDNWKYICFEGQPWLMFDLNQDPYELVNLAHDPAHRDRRTQLQQRLQSWITRTGDTFALPKQ